MAWKIVSIDFSGIENRLVAWMAQDQKRLARFAADPKFSEHRYAAALLMNIDYKDVKKDKDKQSPYAVAKAVVHGADRLLGARKIADKNDLDFQTVKDFMYRWKKEEIGETVEWQNRIIKQVEKQGWLKNPFGRVGYFYTDRYATKGISFLPQSTAACVIYRAMIALMYERIEWPLEKVKRIVQVAEPLPQPANLLASIHDELVFECPEELVPEVARICKRVMEQPWPELGGLVLPVNIAVGDDFGSVKEVDFSL
jgi:DNA polymerase-1